MQARGGFTFLDHRIHDYYCRRAGDICSDSSHVVLINMTITTSRGSLLLTTHQEKIPKLPQLTELGNT
jgi:hypothetical protein